MSVDATALYFPPPSVEIQLHLPPTIVAQNGTAGSVVLCVCMGQLAGGQGIIWRLMDGQHGFSPQA